MRKGQKVNKKGMSKILNFKVCSSVFALAAPLSLKHSIKIKMNFINKLIYSNSHIFCIRGMHTSPGGSGM